MGLPQVLLRLTAVIFAVEGVIMATLGVAGSHLGPWETMLLDAILLVAGSTPLAYLFVIKPYLAHHRREEARAEDRLLRNLAYQKVLNEVLALSLKPLPLDRMLEEAIRLIVTVPCLSLDQKGGMFILGRSGDLEMRAQHGIGKAILESCAHVPLGHCHCGRAAATRQVQFCAHVGETHSVTYEGMQDHGHYCVPILGGDELLGVLNVYVSAGHEWNEEEQRFLETMASGLAGIIRRKTAEDELAHGEARLRAIVDTALDAIITMDHEGRIADFNPAAERIFGHPREKAMGQSLADLIIPQAMREAHHAGLKRLLDTGQAKVLNQRMELTALRHDGREFPVELSITMLRGADGGHPLFVGYLRDITARKDAEAAIRRLARQNELLLASVGEGIYGLDSQGRVTFLNPEGARMLGYGVEELLGQPIHGLIHHSRPDGSPYPAEECPNHDSYARGVSHHVKDEVFWRKDKTSFPVDYFSTPLREDDGTLVGAVVVFRDVTERLANEQAVERERDFVRAAIESLPGIFYLISDKEHFMLWNQNLETVTGYGPDEIAHISPLQLFPEEERMRIAERIQTVLTDGQAETEAPLRTRDGRLIPYYFTGRRCDLNDTPCIIGMGLDITERKSFEEALKHSNEELEQFAYVASHDLQEPLRMVASYTQLLARRYKGRLDKDADEFIGHAVDGATRMQALVKDLLEYSRIGTRKHPFVMTDLGETVAEALQNLRIAIAECDARIEVGPLPSLPVDRHQIARLFQNLIGNAVKYRAPNRSPEVKVAAVLREGIWEFSISDNGIGIPANDFDRVFMIFQRLHGRGEYEGTGIGLAVCKKIIERHGGRIWVDSAEGGGTTFRFTLPMALS